MKTALTILLGFSVLVTHAQISSNNLGPGGSITITPKGIQGKTNSATDTTNVALGPNALMLTTGTNNLGLGFNALRNNTTGSGNVASGANALLSNI